MAVRLTIHHTDRHQTFDSRAQRVIKIGRHGRAHVQLDDPSVSRLHASIELDSRGATLVDLGTVAGTTVGGEAIRGRRILRDDDRIALGDTELRVELEPVVAVPIEVPARRCPPTPPRAPPVPDLTVPDPGAAAAMAERTLPCARGVGRNWLARDYVTSEKYDTHFLVARMNARRRRSRTLTTLGVLAAGVASIVLPVAWSDEPVALPEGIETAAIVELPLPLPMPEPTAPPAHVVRGGETLGSIAADRLGDVTAWRELWRANRDQLPDPSLLEVGMVLALPEL